MLHLKVRNMLDLFLCHVFLSLRLMHILEMSSKVATLSEGLVAEAASERPLTCMLAEMVSQVARLLENRFTIGIHALEVQLDSLCLRISYLNGLMPFCWNALKSLRSAFFIRHDLLRLLVMQKLLHIACLFLLYLSASLFVRRNY